MILEITTQGNYWTAAQIAQIAKARTGLTPAVTVGTGKITLEFGPDLQAHERADLTAYFGAAQDLPDATEYAGKLDAIKTLATSAVGVKLADLSAAQRNALVAALLYQAGAVDKDLKIRPLAEWLK